MIPLHSIAATNIEIVSNAMLIVSIVLLVLAFMVGFGKGFRKVGWRGVACLWALDIFIVVRWILKKINLVFDTSALQQYGEDKRAWTAVIVLLISVVVVLVLYAVCTKIFRPRSKWVTSNPTYLQDGLEFEDDSGEVMGEVQSRLVWKNGGTPTIWGRVIGGLLCALNMLSVLFGIFAVFFLVIGKVPALAEMDVVKAFFAVQGVPTIYEHFCTFGPDYLCICVMFLVAHKGYTHGFFYSLFDLFKMLGGIVFTVLAFYIPFSPLMAEGGMLAFLTPYVTMLGGWVEAVPFVGTLPGAVDIVGKVLLGVVLCVVFLLALWLIKVLLRKATLFVEKYKAMRMIDGILGTVLYFVLGIIVCAGIWAVFYICSHYGWFDFSGFFQFDTFAGRLYRLCETIIKPLLPVIVIA